VIRSRADRDCFELSYASMNWIRFKGSPCRKDAFDGLSAPWRGSPSRVETTTTHAGESMPVCARHHGLTGCWEICAPRFLARTCVLVVDWVEPPVCFRRAGP
jgi:hypothetical protein